MNLKLFFHDSQASSKVEIFSSEGQVLVSKDMDANNSTLNISNLTKGVYKVRVRGKKSIYTTQITRN